MTIVEPGDRHDITVVGGGWSVSNVLITELAGKIIAVNDSAFFLPRWDQCVSMDRLWAENRIDQLQARALKHGPRPVWLRRSAVQNLTDRLPNFPWVHVFDCDNESTDMAEETGRLNGTSSGMCALNLAWGWRPKRLFLLGFDMNRDPRGNAYWYPAYPWVRIQGNTTNGKYQAWAKQFAAVAEAFRLIGCDVFNVSPSSAIDAFQKIRPAEYLRMTR